MSYNRLRPAGSPSFTVRLSLHNAIASNSFKWLHTSAKLFAAIIPLAAAAGTPIPGMHESPHTVKPGIGVLGPGQFPAPPGELADMAGP